MSIEASDIEVTNDKDNSDNRGVDRTNKNDYDYDTINLDSKQVQEKDLGGAGASKLKSVRVMTAAERQGELLAEAKRDFDRASKKLTEAHRLNTQVELEKKEKQYAD